MNSLTLDNANALLAEQGFRARFTDESLEGALRDHRPGRIRDAIRTARNDVGARRFLRNVLGIADRRPADQLARPDRGEAAGTATPVSDQAPGRAPGRYNGHVAAEDLDAGPFDPGPEVARTRDGRTIPLTFKAYGRKGALEFREHDTRQGTPTVMLEAAGSLGERRYDWKNKLSVMIMPRELPEVACVLTGALERCEFRNHGPARNKGYSIERQSGGFFVKVFRSGDNHAMHAVPVPAEEAFFISTLVLRQLARIVPGADSALIAIALRSYAAAKRRGN